MPTVQRQYSNLHVSTMGKKNGYGTGLWSQTLVATEPEGGLGKAAHSSTLYLFSDSSLQGLVEIFRFPHSPLKLKLNPFARLLQAPCVSNFL